MLVASALPENTATGKFFLEGGPYVLSVSTAGSNPALSPLVFLRWYDEADNVFNVVTVNNSGGVPSLSSVANLLPGNYDVNYVVTGAAGDDISVVLTRQAR